MFKLATLALIGVISADKHAATTTSKAATATHTAAKTAPKIADHSADFKLMSCRDCL